ncbi:MAG: RsiV family protein [Lachnospiraceae bacterium]|nr:RsiV family protein [Lachnospiraceae bacterium]
MKKYITGIAIIMSLCIFTGCGAQAPAVDENDANMTQVSEGETGTEIETTSGDENMTFVSENGSAVQENEDKVFFFRKNSIYAVDKASNRTQLFWNKEDYEPSYYMFDGCGILIGEKIYFLEDMEYSGNGTYYTAGVLSVINTDGSGYEQAVSTLDETDALNGVPYGFNSLYFSDHILYAYNANTVRCYRILEDGTLGEEIPREETAFRYTQDLSEDYSLLCMQGDLGNYLSPVESLERYGYLIMKKGTSYVKMDVENGSEEWINFGDPAFMTDDKAFFVGSMSDAWNLQSFDLNTKEIAVIGEIGWPRTVYDNGILYYMSSEDNNKTTVGYLSILDGTGGALFELSDAAGYVNGFSPSYFGLMVSGDYLYYMDMKDYDAYLFRAPLDNLSQGELLEEAIYSTNIKEVGTLAQEHHNIYKEDDPEVLLGTANFDWIVVDDSYAGAETINTYLYESEVASKWAMFEDDVRMDEEFIAEENREYSLQYSYDSSVSNVLYFDGTYVSFIQESYEYYGGAHGLPIWDGYVFNLETGERLLLPDILLSYTEEELKDIVTKYFSEKINRSPSDFWENSEDTVHDMVSLEMTDFALTEDGICFYMHPYCISPYAGGFQKVTIPYTEFKKLSFSPKLSQSSADT